MPNIKSASKRLRQSRKRRTRNRALRSEIRTRTKKLLDAQSAEEAQESYRALSSLLDKAARKGVVPRNAASRRKSRLARYIRRLSA